MLHPLVPATRAVLSVVEVRTTRGTANRHRRSRVSQRPCVWNGLRKHRHPPFVPYPRARGTNVPACNNRERPTEPKGPDPVAVRVLLLLRRHLLLLVLRTMLIAMAPTPLVVSPNHQIQSSTKGDACNDDDHRMFLLLPQPPTEQRKLKRQLTQLVDSMILVLASLLLPSGVSWRHGSSVHTRPHTHTHQSVLDRRPFGAFGKSSTCLSISYAHSRRRPTNESPTSSMSQLSSTTKLATGRTSTQTFPWSRDESRLVRSLQVVDPRDETPRALLLFRLAESGIGVQALVTVQTDMRTRTVHMMRSGTGRSTLFQRCQLLRFARNLSDDRFVS